MGRVVERLRRSQGKGRMLESEKGALDILTAGNEEEQGKTAAEVDSDHRESFTGWVTWVH